MLAEYSCVGSIRQFGIWPYEDPKRRKISAILEFLIGIRSEFRKSVERVCAAKPNDLKREVSGVTTVSSSGRMASEMLTKVEWQDGRCHKKGVALICDFSIIVTLNCSDQVVRETELFCQHSR